MLSIKRGMSLILCVGCILFLFPKSVSAQEENYTIEVTVETIFESNARATSTKTGRKTYTVKNSSGSSLWYVQVEGTFSYTGSSSTCTSSKVIAGSYDSNWKISSKSSSKSANSATATATAKLYSAGAYVSSMTKSVTLKCDANGKLS